ncbi:hypothetical protein MASR2M79_19760 [Aminivibrio sp.]
MTGYSPRPGDLFFDDMEGGAETGISFCGSGFGRSLGDYLHHPERNRNKGVVGQPKSALSPQPAYLAGPEP